MIKIITSRMKFLIEKAQIVPYTKEELKLLSRMLFDANLLAEMNQLHESFDCSDMRYPIAEYVRNGHVDTDWDEDRTKKLNLMQFFLVYYRKAFLIMSCVPLENVPLYLSRGIYYRVLSEWRLHINK